MRGADGVGVSTGLTYYEAKETYYTAKETYYTAKEIGSP
jgi:hypothetical protein